MSMIGSIPGLGLTDMRRRGHWAEDTPRPRHIFRAESYWYCSHCSRQKLRRINTGAVAHLNSDPCEFGSDKAEPGPVRLMAVDDLSRSRSSKTSLEILIDHIKL